MAVKIEYAIQESISNIRRNSFMTFAAVLVVAVSLALGGGALLVKSSINRTAALWTGNVSVRVFLLDQFPSEQKPQLEQELKSMPEVASVQFETKQQAYEKFKQLFANQPALARNVSPEALPESFQIKLKDPRQFTVIGDRFDGRTGLRIRDERDLVKRLFSFADTLRVLALIIAAVVLVAALMLIATTIRMAIYARRKEIGIMKLVGATNWFIRIPFMVEGMVQGAIGALVAVILLVVAKPVVFSRLVQENIDQSITAIKFSITYGDIATYGVYLLAMGIVLGALGSVLGLRRFLDV